MRSRCRTRCGRAWLDQGATPDFDPATTGAALQAGRRPSAPRAAKPALRFAVVHPYSGHNYELRYWLAACGIDPDTRRRDRHRAAAADGRRAGQRQPSTATASASRGARRRRCRATAASPPSRPPSGARARRRCWASARNWAADEPDALAALLRALCRSAQWCAEAGQPRGAGADPLRQGLSRAAGRVDAARLDRRARRGRRRHPSRRRTSSCRSPRRRPSRGRATRCGSIRRWCAGARSRTRPRTRAIARETYRPDLYRAALKPLGVALPGCQRQGRGRAARRRRRSARRAPASRSGRMDSSTARCSIPTSSTRTSRRRSASCLRHVQLHKLCADCVRQ